MLQTLISILRLISVTSSRRKHVNRRKGYKLKRREESLQMCLASFLQQGINLTSPLWFSKGIDLAIPDSTRVRFAMS